jgi:hypothetical protein
MAWEELTAEQIHSRRVIRIAGISATSEAALVAETLAEARKMRDEHYQAMGAYGIGAHVDKPPTESEILAATRKLARKDRGDDAVNNFKLDHGAGAHAAGF